MGRRSGRDRGVVLGDRDVWLVGGLWVVLSVAGQVAAGWLISLWPVVASAQGQITSDTFFQLLRIGIVAFVLVLLIIVFAVVRYRAPDGSLTPASSQVRSVRPVVWGWLIATAGLNAVFLSTVGLPGVLGLWSLDRSAEAGNPLVIDVTAQQWSWHFAYPEAGLQDEQELVVPVNRPLKLVLKSEDVIHSFWVPAWGIKKDVIPGETRILYITPTIEVSSAVDPVARVQCAELCGIGHAVMRAGLRVVSQAAFEAWLAERQAAQSAAPSMGPDMSMAPIPSMSMAPMPTP